MTSFTTQTNLIQIICSTTLPYTEYIFSILWRENTFSVLQQTVDCNENLIDFSRKYIYTYVMRIGTISA